VRTEAPHIQEWMGSHESLLVDRTVSTEFERYLESRAWTPSRLDWSLVEHVEFEMAEGWEVDVVDFANATPLGRHSHLMFMYSGSEPSLVALMSDGLRDVDLIYSASAGARYFCGVDMVSGALVPAFEDFAEFDGFATGLSECEADPPGKSLNGAPPELVSDGASAVFDGDVSGRRLRRRRRRR